MSGNSSISSLEDTEVNSSKNSGEDDISEGRITPTNSFEKRQPSTNSSDSETELSGLDLVRVIVNCKKSVFFFSKDLLSRLTSRSPQQKE